MMNLNIVSCIIVRSDVYSLDCTGLVYTSSGSAWCPLGDDCKVVVMLTLLDLQLYSLQHSNTPLHYTTPPMFST